MTVEPTFLPNLHGSPSAPLKPLLSEVEAAKLAWQSKPEDEPDPVVREIGMAAAAAGWAFFMWPDMVGCAVWTGRKGGQLTDAEILQAYLVARLDAEIWAGLPAAWALRDNASSSRH
jgi:hypothetical protein